jgi:gamma-glutamyltranspeptidase / glutathione hydrolase
MKKILTLLLLPGLFSCHLSREAHKHTALPDTFHFQSQKRVVARHGVVVSAHPLASAVGVSILQQGGNAIDAAIATQFALAVVYPTAGNIGGGGFMVARLSNAKLLALDYRETAPIHADRDMYLDNAGNVLTGKSVNGHLASGVPGTVAGLVAASKYGRLSFGRLVQPAIDIAEKGFAVTAAEALSLNAIQVDLAAYNSVLPVFARRQGWKEGDTLVQPDLAKTLKRIRDQGQKGFYGGETARLIVEEMKRGGGIITPQDLDSYKAVFRDPHVFDYKAYRIVGMPMPSSGAVLVHQMMKMVEDRGIDRMGFGTTSSVQLMTEVERRAFADRAAYMGDADFVKVPVEKLTDAGYLSQRMKDYDAQRPTPSSQVSAGNLPQHESEQTTHLSVIDDQGNAVAVTTTLNNSFGSKTVVAGAGFFMNDEMDDFSAKPGVPNLYGAVGGEANAIVPGKRMLSSMTPTIVLQNNAPFLVLGTPGGTTIPTSVFQTLVDIFDFHMSTMDAVNKPKFHHQWLPDTLEVEEGFDATVAAGLQRMGYRIEQRGSIGRTEVIRVLPDGSFEGVADSRGGDGASGY